MAAALTSLLCLLDAQVSGGTEETQAALVAASPRLDSDLVSSLAPQAPSPDTVGLRLPHGRTYPSQI
jgi:hypothetical protein